MPPVDVDAEGFMTDPGQWNEPIAEAIAAENGIPELTDRHWLVVRFMRERYLDDGSRAIHPLARQGVRRSGQGALRSSSPRGPAKLAAKIGGIPKPKGCI